MTNPREHVLIVGVRRPQQRRQDMLVSLEELARLVDTANGVVVGQTTQELHRLSSATYIHRGKVAEIGALLGACDVQTVVLDADLSPAQQRNLSEAWGCKVLDRTAVILDIFARRAHSEAGKLQVELAQLSYRLPRLVGRGLGLMQQAGYIGNRGPGETKLEIDRRRIRDRMAFLRRQLRALTAHRARHRGRRQEIPLPIVALVGYTNAGKSTLLNRLTAATVFVENRLFATLDPTVRQLRLPSGREILLVDTVGFIRNLPHELVEAFYATFEEIAQATLLCHVVDASSTEALPQQHVVDDVLRTLGVADLPRVLVYNKWDLVTAATPLPAGAIPLSSHTGHGTADLLTALEQRLAEHHVHVNLLLPYDAVRIVSELYRVSRVLRAQHGADGIALSVLLPPAIVGRYARWVVS